MKSKGGILSAGAMHSQVKGSAWSGEKIDGAPPLRPSPSRCTSACRAHPCAIPEKQVSGVVGERCDVVDEHREVAVGSNTAAPGCQRTMASFTSLAALSSASTILLSDMMAIA